MPDQLDDYRGQLEANSREACVLAEGLDDARFNWRPEPGRWSMAECLAHLNATNGSYLPAIDHAIAEARARGWRGHGPFRYSFLSSFMVRWAEPPVKVRARAPRVFAPPRELPLAEGLPAFLRLQGEVVRRLEDARGLDLRRARVVSPVTRFVRLNLGAAFALIAAHNRRHLWQARRLREHPDFPHA
jgi:hypothetical protein